ncbi:MAG: hypothetical protein QM723_08155 [Myxococcaceae bacterium]
MAETSQPEVKPVPPAPVPTASPSPAPTPVQAADRAQEEKDNDLVAAPSKAAPVIAQVKRYDIRQFNCEPNERWRASAKRHLEELQQTAASKEDKKAWALFEDAEGKLDPLIERAASGSDCEAVEQRIQKLAVQLNQKR